MLESIREKAQGPWAKLILVLITVPFALVGIESYFTGAARDKAVATVGKDAISQTEFDQSLKNQQDRLREMLGKNYDPSMFESMEAREAVLNNIVDQRLVTAATKAAGVHMSDAQLFERVSNEPAFQEDGKFSMKRFEEVARRFGNKTTLERQLREEGQLKAFSDSVVNTAFTSKTVIDQMVRNSEASRDIAMISYQPDAYKDKVKLDEARVNAFYEANKTTFQVPEQVKVEFLELSVDALAAAAKADPAAVAKNYEENKARFSTQEERRASHILISAGKDAKAEVKAAAKEKAARIFAETKADPSKLAALAKTESGDPGSAQNGGDLGFFGKKVMTPAFEAATFAASKGDVVGPIETEFGFHIIQVTDIKAPTIKTLDQVRPEIEAELKKAQAQAEFAKLQPIFSEAVFTNPNSLQAAVEKTGLKSVTTPFFSKGQPSMPQLGNPKIMNEIFSDEVRKNKKNTAAVDVGNGTYIAARVVELKEAVTRPVTEVRLQIEQRIMREESSNLAKAEGEARLADAIAKKADLKWPAALTVSRAKAGGLPPDVVEKALKADARTLPAYVGYSSPQGTYFLVQISKVNEVQIDDAKRKEVADRMKQQQQGVDVSQLIASLKTDSPVNINKAMVEKKQQ